MWLGRLDAISVGVAILGVVSANGQAHPRDTWYWSAAYASNELNKGFCSDVCRTPARSLCRGRVNDPLTGKPAWMWNKQHSLRLFKHHDCTAYMANGAVWTLVMHVKGKTNWEGSNLKLARRAGSAPPPAQPPSSGEVYFDTGSGHWIQDITPDGAVITLEDGSRWLVDPIDRLDTELWLAVDDITVLDGSNPSYPYRLIDTDPGGGPADARFLGYS
jgi:hypothetical protein